MKIKPFKNKRPQVGETQPTNSLYFVQVKQALQVLDSVFGRLSYHCQWNITIDEFQTV